MQDGWVKVYREFTKWQWYSDIKVSRLFLHLLLTANHKAARWKGIEIQPGQRVISFRNLADETGLSLRELRTALGKLKKSNNVTYTTTQKITVFSIVNWRKYQTDYFESDTQKGTQETHQRHNSDTIVTTNNNDNNNKKEKNEKNINISTSFSDYAENISSPEQKHCYGQYKNVFLTDSDIQQLIAKFGYSYKEKIEAFSEGLELKGYTYNNHCLAIMKWFDQSADTNAGEDILLMNMDTVPIFRK